MCAFVWHLHVNKITSANRFKAIAVGSAVGSDSETV